MTILLRLSIHTTRLVHLLLLFFALLGWLLPWTTGQLIHLIYLPLMVLQWRLNGGTCVLTNLEEYLQCRLAGAMAGEDANCRIQLAKSEQQGHFVKRVIGLFIDPVPPEHVIQRLIYGSIVVSGGLSLLRLLW